MREKNLVYITIDSLRYDHLSINGYNRKTDSHLSKFTKEGRIFMNAFANGSNTETSFPSILSFQKKLSHETVFISEVLKSHGYSTVGTHSNPYLRLYQKGFQVFCDLEEVPVDFNSDSYVSFRYALKSIIEKLLPYHSIRRESVYELSKLYQFFIAQKRTPYVNAEVVNEKALFFVKKAKPPFFLWLHYMDVHMPYLPPLEYRPSSDTFTTYLLNQRLLKACAKKSGNIFSKSELQKLINLYDGSIRYLDKQIGLLIVELEKMGINQDNTVFIFTSDHGDEFGDYGGIGHPPFRDNESLLHVPLMMVGPNIQREHVEEKITLDYINPNILKLLDFPIPEKVKSKVLF
jgi:arylsulfatase A-like enzyme